MYGSRFLLVRYEDLAMNPERLARKLYAFVEEPFTSAVDAFVRRKMLLDLSNDGRIEDRFSLDRKSRSRVNLWQRNLLSEEIFSIQQDPRCFHVLTSLGYDLINLNKLIFMK